ncbi:MAG: SurA N-terminal domain-containing protein [Duncaniella sp.]|uniref:SurA N-terminal domain-containing protein n=1 Tax=Duncaniella sp. TaxID=2518496 RepID=UPI0023D66AD8|nr:SurA N-terminal domain-containing protein [Duncaniella sp.]MDE6090708.1 SurA N-terminal domain-containing protein [Duncaniella sp.]
MATLEKIRSKSALLLIIVGAGLLAFIIGDFFTSGRTIFGTGTTIAKVDGNKIDIQEFQRRVQDASQQAQAQNQRMDNAVLQQQVLNAMIAEKLFDQEIKDLGLTVTDQELTDMMVGKNSQYVDRMVQQQLGVPDAKTAHDMAFNPTKYGMQQAQAQQLQAYWIDLENNVERMLLQQKFQNLFAGTLVANELDAKALYDDNAATAHIIYAKKDFSSLKDDDFEVSDSDINALYNKDKNRYALDEPTRTVSYIAVNIVPSEADVLAGQKKVEDALLALNNNPELQGIATMPEFVGDRNKITQSDVDKQARLKAALDSLSVGRATLVSKNGNDYTLAKLIGKDQEVAQVKIDFLAVQGSRAQVDSLVGQLNAGVSFDSVSASPLVAQAQKDMEVSLLDANAASVKELIDGRATGIYFTPDTLAEGGRIMRVSQREAPVTVYDLATITFTTEPSNATINELDAALRKYVDDNKDSKTFAENAQEAGYTTFPATVSASSPTIGNLNDSHAAVAWVMDAKKGQVSPVFGDVQTGRFIAVAVNDIYDGGYVPARDAQVHTILAAQARNDKKAAKLLADYDGKAKDVAGYAQLMNVSVDTTTVNFGQYMVPGLGMSESAVQGKVANAQKGALVGPMQANNSVIVLQVTDIDNEGRPYDFQENSIRYNQQRGASRMMNSLDRILLGNKKVSNNINKFYK